MKIYFETNLETPFNTVKEKFNQDLFSFLKPPAVELEIERFDGCKKGDEIHLGLKIFKLRQKWVSLVTEDLDQAKEWSFVDEGKKLPWPLTFWRHHHRVLKISEQTTKIIDDMSFECSPKAMEKMVYPVMWLMFSVRPSRYREYYKESV